jgi:ornithine carbamoyltransferase
LETRKALFKGRDYITTEEYSEAEIEILLDVSADLKRKFKGAFRIAICPIKPSS